MVRRTREHDVDCTSIPGWQLTQIPRHILAFTPSFGPNVRLGHTLGLNRLP